MSTERWYRVKLDKIKRDTEWVKADNAKEAADKALTTAYAGSMGEYDTIKVTNVGRHYPSLKAYHDDSR